jgi:hypothetical protein
MLGLSEQQISALKKGCRLRVDDRIYVVTDHQLRTFTIDHSYQQRKKAEIEHFAMSHAINNELIYRIEIKNGNGEHSTWQWSGEPPQESWTYAREFVDTAFSHAMNDGRTIPNDIDWQYARNVESGEVELDWWDAGLMSA